MMRTSASLLVALTVLLVTFAPTKVLGAKDVAQFVKKTVGDHPIVIFSKSYCPYCARAKEVFSKLEITPHIIELDQRDDGPTIQGTLAGITGRRTVPQVFISGEFFGGSDDTIEAYESGKLAKLLSSAGKAEL